jgi:hypothetical protein
VSTSRKMERVSGWFTASTIEDAVRQARAWAEAEPNIEHYELVSIEAVDGRPRRGLWDVTWDLAFKKADLEIADTPN